MEMIKTLERYIAKTVFFSTAITGIVITGVLMLMLLLGEVKSIGEGDYNLYQALIYVLLRLPNELYHFSPMLILLGSIISLSILSTHRELAVMRVSGFSIRQIMLSVISAAFVIIASISIIGESVGPKLNYQAEILKENAKNEGQVVVTSAGLWLHIQNNFIHVKRVVGRQFLEGVTRYEFSKEHRLQAVYFANKLTYQQHWQMFDGVKTVFKPESTATESFSNMAWDLPINANLLSAGLLEPNQMTLSKLANFSHYLRKNGLQATEYQSEYWQRIFQPLASLLMIFLAMPFVLGANKSAALGWRVVIGIIVGFMFYILNAFFGQLSIVYQIPPSFGALLPLIIFTFLGILLSKKLIRL